MGDHHRNPFARGTSAQLPIQTRDCFNRVLGIGDEVIVPELKTPSLTVLAVNPVLDPAAPPNAVSVTLQLLVSFVVKADTATRQFIRIRTAEERGIPPEVIAEAQAAGNGSGGGVTEQ